MGLRRRKTPHRTTSAVAKEPHRSCTSHALQASGRRRRIPSRRPSPSQPSRMLLDALRPRIVAHEASPNGRPVARIQTIQAQGKGCARCVHMFSALLCSLQRLTPAGIFRERRLVRCRNEMDRRPCGRLRHSPRAVNDPPRRSASLVEPNHSVPAATRTWLALCSTASRTSPISERIPA